MKLLRRDFVFSELIDKYIYSCTDIESALYHNKFSQNPRYSRNTAINIDRENPYVYIFCANLHDSFVQCLHIRCSDDWWD